MNKLFLLFLSIAFSTQALTAKSENDTQSRYPLVVDGKQWNETFNTSMADYNYHYYISGDTVIRGENYKKCYLTYTFSPREGEAQQLGLVPVTYPPEVIGWLQEHDSKVLFLNNYGYKFVLYDFNLNVGDIPFENDDYVQKVTKKDTIVVNGRELRRLWLTETVKKNGNFHTGYWVEGVGSNYGLEWAHEWVTMPSNKMRECLEDGNVVFTATDFDPSAVGRVEDGMKCAIPTIAIDNGKLVFRSETPKAECVYKIKCADNYSGRGGEVSLSQLFKIEVYAVLEGHLNSDVAVATIGWRNGKLVMEGFSSVTLDGNSNDVNGDGTVDVADIATVISAMAAQ